MSSEDAVADSVYRNGRVYTVDADFSVASALAISGDRFVCVGSDEDVGRHIGGRTEVVDLQGRTVLPGLINSHLHLLSVGLSLMQLDAFLKPKKDILNDVAAAYRGCARGEWVKGWGWSQVQWDPAVFPTRHELDGVAPDSPVILYRVCGHAAWVNSRALELAGVTADTPEPPGGEIIRDGKGVPTGVLIDTAMNLVSRLVPDPTEKDKIEALLAAQEHLLSFGTTGARDADAGCTLETIERMKKLYGSGDLRIRMYQMCSPGEATEHFYRVPEGERTGLFNNRYSIRSVKLMGDGSLGGGSAWLLDDYSDRPGHRGNPRYSDDELYGLVREARRANFQVNTHAIGDAAVRQALDAYQRVLREMPGPDHRYCIEHAEVVAMQDIPRFAELGVLPSVQAIFTSSDWSMAESRLGKESQRLRGVNAFRRFIESGSMLPNGTDSPVEPVNLFHSLYAAVTRSDLGGQPPGGWHPEERLTREEALRSHTVWAAYAQFEESREGSIEAGKLADFVVIDRDYMSCPVDEIKDIQALRTVLGGETLYTRN
ncbi:MAG: amidohydrolase [Dehalococcoidia bacterium]